MLSVFPYLDSFAALEKWAKDLPDQCIGLPQSICETGEPYVEFFAHGLARPADSKIIESVVASTMHRQLETYFKGRKGRIYWRIPIEIDISTQSIVLKFDENGPDIDWITDRKCVQDHNWVGIKAYCRLYKAHKSLIDA